MKANIKNNKFITLGFVDTLNYDVLNPEIIEFDINTLFKIDINNNPYIIPININDEYKTCEIKINDDFDGSFDFGEDL